MTRPAPSRNLAWQRTGIVIPRAKAGAGAEVVGDPCIVWDQEVDAWRMVLFFDPPGHGTAISSDLTGAPGTWSTPEPIEFANPEALPTGGGTHKPFIVMDAERPNHAAFAGGRYWMVTVSFTGASREKRVQRAWSTSLGGPWTIEQGDLIARGGPGEFDENHVDAVSGFWFEGRQEFLYFYMGYPLEPQPWPHSPYGNALGVASQRLGEPAVKRGVALAPSGIAGHWTAGYFGGLQLFRGEHHRWAAVINASPTAPDRLGNKTSEEPAPSLGGLAYCDEDYPVSGWTVADEPFEWIEEIPADALTAGEGANLWRHHALFAPGLTRLFYNSGVYGTEQLYSKVTTDPLD